VGHQADALPPDTNATPTTDNGAHGKIRAIPLLEGQIDTFLQTGQVVSTCPGPCVYPGF
jgi:hypothetical protein